MSILSSQCRALQCCFLLSCPHCLLAISHAGPTKNRRAQSGTVLKVKSKKLSLINHLRGQQQKKKKEGRHSNVTAFWVAAAAQVCQAFFPFLLSLLLSQSAGIQHCFILPCSGVTELPSSPLLYFLSFDRLKVYCVCCVLSGAPIATTTTQHWRGPWRGWKCKQSVHGTTWVVRMIVVAVMVNGWMDG